MIVPEFFPYWDEAVHGGVVVRQRSRETEQGATATRNFVPSIFSAKGRPVRIQSIRDGSSGSGRGDSDCEDANSTE